MALRPATALAVLVAAICAIAPAAAAARDGGGGRPEVRVAGACGHGATSQLRLRARDGAIELEFEVDERRAGRLWRVVVVHEHRVAWRGRARTRGPSGSFSLERRLGDYTGSDQVMARAVGPGGITCQATATLP
ncbi:MAG: hypothetical protein ACXVFL_09465 [Solirubrobacteraceae bacterium]